MINNTSLLLNFSLFKAIPIMHPIDPDQTHLNPPQNRVDLLNLDIKEDSSGYIKPGKVSSYYRDKGQYSTIVVGRQGVSRSKEFLFGSISSKIINPARNYTVWIVE
jgi:hypothetical protein